MKMGKTEKVVKLMYIKIKIKIKNPFFDFNKKTTIFMRL